MSEPLAYFLTWTTFGTWLPGDDRGWVEVGEGIQSPDPIRRKLAQQVMTESACRLDRSQREIVEQTITDHCRIRGWQLYAVNCRTNHVHVVIGASLEPKKVRSQFKAYCTRRLREHQFSLGYDVRKDWWTEGGSQRYLNTVQSRDATIHYVLHGQ